MFALVRAVIIESFYEFAEIRQLSASQSKIEGKAVKKNKENEVDGIEDERFFCVEIDGEEEFNLVKVLKDSNLFFVY